MSKVGDGAHKNRHCTSLLSDNVYKGTVGYELRHLNFFAAHGACDQQVHVSSACTFATLLVDLEGCLLNNLGDRGFIRKSEFFPIMNIKQGAQSNFLPIGVIGVIGVIGEIGVFGGINE